MYTINEIRSIGNWKMRLTLAQIPLNELDQVIKDMWQKTYDHYKPSGGPISMGINEGDIERDPYMPVTFDNKNEYVQYSVFVAKIRRESAGLSDTPQERRVKWTEMVQAFIDQYGEAKTPPDIKVCVADVRKHFSIPIPTTV